MTTTNYTSLQLIRRLAMDVGDAATYVWDDATIQQVIRERVESDGKTDLVIVAIEYAESKMVHRTNDPVVLERYEKQIEWLGTLVGESIYRVDPGSSAAIVPVQVVNYVGNAVWWQYRKATTIPAPPTSGVQISHGLFTRATPGWSTMSPSPSRGEPVWKQQLTVIWNNDAGSYSVRYGNVSQDSGFDGVDGAPGRDGQRGEDGDPGEDGIDGIDGNRGNALLAVYRRTQGTAAPNTPLNDHTDTGRGWYTWEAPDGWTAPGDWYKGSPPAGGGEYVWVSVGVAIPPTNPGGTPLLGDAAAIRWSDPIRLTGVAGEDGDPGADGAQGDQGAFYLVAYRDAHDSSPPPTPTGGLFTLKHGAVNSRFDPPSGWRADPGSPPAGQVVFESRAFINPADHIHGATSFTPSAWSTPSRYTGRDGKIGRFYLNIYQNAPSQPSQPRGGDYDISSRTLTPPRGWAETHTTPLSTEKTYHSQAVVDLPVDAVGAFVPNWGVVSEASSSGAPGPVGATGPRGFRGSAVLLVFRSAASQPSTPAAAQYNQQTGVWDAPSGWHKEPPPRAAGEFVWVSAAEVTPSAATGSITLSWSGASRITGDAGPVGGTGPKGRDGISRLAVFLNASSQPASPTAQSTDFNVSTQAWSAPPGGWRKEPTTPTEPEVTWVSYAEVSYPYNAVGYVAPQWQTPVQSSGHKGDTGPAGEDGADALGGFLGSWTFLQEISGATGEEVGTAAFDPRLYIGKRVLARLLWSNSDAVDLHLVIGQHTHTGTSTTNTGFGAYGEAGSNYGTCTPASFIRNSQTVYIANITHTTNNNGFSFLLLVTDTTHNTDLAHNRYPTRIDFFADGASSESSRSFLGLDDTPSAYGTAGQVPVVNAAGNGLVFANQSGGNVNLGNISQDVVPDSDDTRDIGSETHRWNEIYANNMQTRNLWVPDGSGDPKVRINTPTSLQQGWTFTLPDRAPGANNRIMLFNSSGTAVWTDAPHSQAGKSYAMDDAFTISDAPTNITTNGVKNINYQDAWGAEIHCVNGQFSMGIRAGLFPGWSCRVIFQVDHAVSPSWCDVAQGISLRGVSGTETWRSGDEISLIAQTSSMVQGIPHRSTLPNDYALRSRILTPAIGTTDQYPVQSNDLWYDMVIGSPLSNTDAHRFGPSRTAKFNVRVDRAELDADWSLWLADSDGAARLNSSGAASHPYDVIGRWLRIVSGNLHVYGRGNPDVPSSEALGGTLIAVRAFAQGLPGT